MTIDNEGAMVNEGAVVLSVECVVVSSGDGSSSKDSSKGVRGTNSNWLLLQQN